MPFLFLATLKPKRSAVCGGKYTIMDDSYTMPMNKWSLRCKNLECGMFYEKQTFEPDVICPRCAGTLEVNHKIIFKEDSE